MTAARPHTLTSSISPVLVGYFGTLAYGGGCPVVDNNRNSNIFLSSLTWRWLCFCLLIQLGTNLHNDYADFVLGADDEHRKGQARATQKKWVTPFQMAAASTICLTIALLIGTTLVWQIPATSNTNATTTTTTTTTKTVAWLVIASSIFNAFAYTGGNCYPFSYLGWLRHVSIGYSGLGDVVCFLYFGLVATLMIPYLWWAITTTTTTTTTTTPLQSSSSSSSLTEPHPSAWLLWCILASQVGCFATAILVVNNIRDRHTDVGANKRTMVVRFGIVMARVEYAVLVLTPYLLVLCTKWFLVKEDVILLPIMTLPLFTKQLQAVSGGEKDGFALNPHVGGTARVQFLFCLLQSASLYLVYSRRTNSSNSK